ncbi:MAG: biotin/lipoyl-containing protein [Bryobacteraceae bacterium]
MKRAVDIDGRMSGIVWSGDGEVSWEYATADDDYEGRASVHRIEDGVYSILIGGAVFEARVEEGAVTVGGNRYAVRLRDPREWAPGANGVGGQGHTEVKAPMPGKVIRVLVEVGAEVEAGQGIAVVEAMKMQNEMRAARPGVVSAIRVATGDAVAAGQVLAVID